MHHEGAVNPSQVCVPHEVVNKHVSKGGCGLRDDVLAFARILLWLVQMVDKICCVSGMIAKIINFFFNTKISPLSASICRH